jgi:hypothetical protein
MVCKVKQLKQLKEKNQYVSIGSKKSKQQLEAQQR